MNRQLISSGSTFETEIGYSRAVVVDNWIFVSGTTGYNYNTMKISESVEEQADQCIKNIIEALGKANSNLGEVVQILYILPNADDFPKCWPILKKYFGDIRPAATMMSAGLANINMKIEIQVTAIRKNNQTNI